MTPYGIDIVQDIKGKEPEMVIARRNARRETVRPKNGTSMNGTVIQSTRPVLQSCGSFWIGRILPVIEKGTRTVQQNTEANGQDRGWWRWREIGYEGFGKEIPMGTIRDFHIVVAICQGRFGPFQGFRSDPLVHKKVVKAKES